MDSPSNKRSISPIPKPEFTGISLAEPSTYAAGATGVKVALEHTFKEMGVWKSLKALMHMNQKDGFDCPGCAWPDPDKKRSSFAEYCENGAKALAEEATNQRVDPDFFALHSIEEIASWSDYKIGKSGRITHPVILRPGKDHYEAIEWEEAFEEIAKQLNALESPDEAVFYTSGRSSNEAAFLYGLFARAYGTNNMPDCSNMCHESSGVALKESLGIGKGSVLLEDFEKAEVVMILGQNPGTNHPRMLSALEKCKKNGGKIVAINPLIEAGLKRFKNPQKLVGYTGSGTELADHYLQVKINQDIPLLKAIMKKLYLRDKQGEPIFDHDFIHNNTRGYESLIMDLATYQLEELIERSGVDEAYIDQVVDLLASSKKIIICWAMGLTQHKNGVENIRECVNLLLLKGSIGKEGAGTCPVRGHSNVQGDRSVGIVSKTTPQVAESIEKAFGFKSPEGKGLDTVHSIEAMHEGRAKVFFALGGNFLSAAPDTLYTAKALQNCELTVSVSTKLNRTHTLAGRTSIILPTLGRSEKDLKNGKARKLSVENSMGKVHATKGLLKPASDQLMSEPEIIARLAKHTLQSKVKVNWLEMGENYELIREKIAEVVSGFEDYNEKISSKNSFYLPNNARKGDWSSLPYGQAHFANCALPEHSLEKDEFLLMTIRSHDQFNTTIYGLNDRYRGVKNERRVLFMNIDDMERMGLKKQDLVNISSEYDGVKRVAEQFLVIPYSIPKQNLACYFPESNVLVPLMHFADKSHTPISKSIKVKLEKIS
ncbi:MAG: FdhF/YdeP family oxidoreductase [Bacteroidia bacterium]|nr:FdhF/YdeP family oxidoreductase [Bacteroidia bacterium]